MDKDHYICTGGCRGVSKVPGVCQSKECPLYSEPLDRCDCEDGNHYGAFENENNRGENNNNNH
ncbi:hypothetical protein HY967_02160 [Candidatus Jorgensenbacteria bacterium]|nr:hypothetical protein [Candidatus Jorgensenbacteria bacterium]